MLSKLTVKNVALIRYLELDFCERLNILSGETGAGKSIIVDSLLLLLGQRYDKTILRHGEKEGFVEGMFDGGDYIGAALEDTGFEKDEAIIVNRKFFENGRNEIRINGRLSTTQMLSRLMGGLVDIYGQNEYQSLALSKEHLKILDAFLKRELYELSDEYAVIYKDYQRVLRELKDIGEAKERERNIDILRYQLDEIVKADIKEGEEEELLSVRKIIASSEKITSALNAVYNAINGGDEAGGAAFIDDAYAAMQSVSGLSVAYKELAERLKSASIELGDIADTAYGQLNAVEFDEAALEKIERRLELIRSLTRKYGAVKELNGFKKKTEELLNNLENGAFLFEKLQKEKNKILDCLFTLAEKMSALRKEGAKKFEKLMVNELIDLGMDGAEFLVNFGDDVVTRENFEKFLSADGIDRPEFYFSANKGQPVKPLIKIISGGELSRFMLALKTVSSVSGSIKTMIFDEIDTGISGKIGQEVAKKLASIAVAHQVLCVTHLPQIASMADYHFYIEKAVNSDETETTVKLLSEDGHIEEVARLSGAKGISSGASETARQMTEWSKSYKASLN